MAIVDTKHGFNLRKSNVAITGLDDTIYYNLSFTNSSATRAVPVMFNETRASPILDNPSDYNVSCIRFTMPIGAVPLFDFNDYPGMSVTLHANTDNKDYQTALVFVSTFTPNVTGVSTIAPVYSYQEIVEMINTALLASFVALAAGSAGQPLTQAPFIVFDETTGIFSMFSQTLGSLTPGNEVLVYFSWPLAQFFGPNFPRNVVNTTGGSTAGKDLQIPFYYTGTNQLTLTVGPAGRPNPVGGNLYRMSQEYPALGLFLAGGMRSLIITSSMPIKSENYANSGSNGSPITSPVISDLSPVISSAPDNQRGFLQYQPSVYRYTDMASDQPLSSLNFAVLWQDQAGDTFSLYLLPFQSCELKLMFVRKGRESAIPTYAQHFRG